MAPREKAAELVNKYFLSNIDIDWYDSVDCALIAVDEMLNEYNKYLQSCNTKDLAINYWIEVKQEIERL